MSRQIPSGCTELIAGLDAAVAGSHDTARITSQVEHLLATLITRRAVSLPASFIRSTPNSYARRLIHQNEVLDYTAIAMVWGPNQGTPVHDHNGLWCVEGVLDGALEITQYDLAEVDGVRYRFVRQKTIHAGVGSAGKLIPPFDYHTIANASSEAVAITIHVYGGEMDACSAFLPLSDGWYQREERELRYSAA